MKTALDQSGLTLVEMLASVAIFVTVISIPIGVLFVGEASSRYLGTWEDQNQTLRQAMKQITDDAAFALWVNDGDGALTLYGYLPITNDTQAFWADHPGWPGDFVDAYLLTVKYELQSVSPDNSCLWRRLTYDPGDGVKEASRQLVACGLMPTSHLTKAGQILEVELNARQTEAGGTRIAQVYTKIFLGQDPSASPGI